MDANYGLRWQEFKGKEGTIVTKEKWFISPRTREIFAGKLVDKDNFYQILAYSDPNPTNLNSTIREALMGFSQVTLSSGVWTVRQGFFYSHGGSPEKLAAIVLRTLGNIGIHIQVLDRGEHYASFRGGASVAAQSHWWVKFKVV